MNEPAVVEAEYWDDRVIRQRLNMREVWAQGTSWSSHVEDPQRNWDGS